MVMTMTMLAKKEKLLFSHPITRSHRGCSTDSTVNIQSWSYYPHLFLCYNRHENKRRWSSSFELGGEVFEPVCHGDLVAMGDGDPIVGSPVGLEINSEDYDDRGLNRYSRSQPDFHGAWIWRIDLEGGGVELNRMNTGPGWSGIGGDDNPLGNHGKRK